MTRKKAKCKICATFTNIPEGRLRFGLFSENSRYRASELQVKEEKEVKPEPDLEDLVIFLQPAADARGTGTC